jgi:hypothetical protein
MGEGRKIGLTAGFLWAACFPRPKFPRGLSAASSARDNFGVNRTRLSASRSRRIQCWHFQTEPLFVQAKQANFCSVSLPRSLLFPEFAQLANIPPLVSRWSELKTC